MKNILLYIVFFFSALSGIAQAPDDLGQQNGKRQEKIKALYVAYITQQLSLTPDEAQKFWPIHGQYDAELRAVNMGNTNELDKQQAALNVKKKYQANFIKILGADRTNDFYRKDAEFRKRMIEKLKQLRQKQNERQGGNGGMKRRPNAEVLGDK
jgi:sulfite reductase alpha subunit-like flavoprotein